MHSNVFLFLFLGFVSQAISTSHTRPHSHPTPPLNSSTPFETGFPLCAIPGFTQIPGNYTEIIEAETNSTLKCCLDQCRAAFPACQSIAFNGRYTECLFFNREVQGTQLVRDNGSGFVHYDLKCHVR